MKSPKELTPWQGLPMGFEIDGYGGFVYLIENRITHQKYIGKKFFWQNRKKKVRGKKRSKRVTSESDWRMYLSSCTELKNDIALYGLESFEFKVLSLHKTRAEVNYAEIKEQFLRDVLFSRLPSGEYAYYNKNIMNRYFRKNED